MSAGISAPIPHSQVIRVKCTTGFGAVFCSSVQVLLAVEDGLPRKAIALSLYWILAHGLHSHKFSLACGVAVGAWKASMSSCQGTSAWVDS